VTRKSDGNWFFRVKWKILEIADWKIGSGCIFKLLEEVGELDESKKLALLAVPAQLRSLP
jgi:hypothetical protein